MLERLTKVEVNELRVVCEHSEQCRVLTRLVEVHRSKVATSESRLFPAFHDLVQRMLTLDPEQRIDPDSALEHEFMVATAALGPGDISLESDSKTPWPVHHFATDKRVQFAKKPARRNSFITREQKRTAETTPAQSSSGGSGGRETSSSGRSQDDMKIRRRSLTCNSGRDT